MSGFDVELMISYTSQLTAVELPGTSPVLFAQRVLLVDPGTKSSA